MHYFLKPVTLFLLAVAIGLAGIECLSGAPVSELITISVLTKDGNELVGTTTDRSIKLGTEGDQEFLLSDLLSYHSADEASEHELATIASSLEQLGNVVTPAAEGASARLTDIGLPVMTPLLKGYPDNNATEPDYRYRLFGRIMPGHADALDRSLGLVRLTKDRTVRANPDFTPVKIQDASGTEIVIPSKDIRRISVLQSSITKTFDLHALHHCTYVGFLDVGIITTSKSKVKANSKGYVRLSFDEDGWSTDPHGIVEPLEGKRKLQEGFRWGSVLARVGPTGERWFVGKHFEKTGVGSGRLYFVINDNEHWQNNIGSFRVSISVENAFDVGEPY